MKRKKRINAVKLCIAIISIGLTICLFYSIGYVPIIGNIIAEIKLNEYSNTLEENIQKIDTKYDWYNNEYLSISDNRYILSYKLQNNTIYDETVANQVNLAAKKQYSTIKKEFSQNLSFPSGIWVWTEFDANEYSIKCQRLYLTGIYNIESISEEESEKMPATIAKEFINLMGENYNFTGIQLIYLDKNGGYTIEISADTFNKLEYQDMLNKTRKMEEKELGEEYFEWLANNKFINY